MNLARYPCDMVPRKYRIELDSQDIGQVLDGLEVRRDAWRRTAEVLESGEMPDGEFFVAEECSDADEARWLAERYDAIIGKIREQMDGQC